MKVILDYCCKDKCQWMGTRLLDENDSLLLFFDGQIVYRNDMHHYMLGTNLRPEEIIKMLYPDLT